MAFLEHGKTTAAVIAKDEGVEVDVINAHDLREILKLSPDLRPASITAASAAEGNLRGISA